MSDHKLITVYTQINIENKKWNTKGKMRDKIGTLNFMSGKVKWTEMKNELKAVEWMKETEGKNVEEIYEFIYETIYCISLKFVPARRTTYRKNEPKDRKILMRQKTKINKKLKTELNTRKVDYREEPN